MKATDIPAKFQIPFANAANSPFIRTIPKASQIGIQNGAASLTDGFPPDTFSPAGAGGVPPFGADFNGLLNQSTGWDRWLAAGGPVAYDGTFSTAIGGYPKGTVLQAQAIISGFWVSTVDDNATNPDAGGANWTAFQAGPPAGGAFLNTVDPIHLILNPTAGGFLWINGINYQVTNPVLTNSGLSANTEYGVYAYINAGVMTLEASPTGYALNSTNGIPQKIGDVTRTLVGGVWTNTSAQFEDNAFRRNVATWFNRRIRPLQAGVTNSAVTSTSFVEIDAAHRAEALVWGDDGQFLTLIGSIVGSSGTGQCAVGIDGVAQSSPSITSTPTSAGAAMGTSLAVAMADGHHTIMLFGLSQTGSSITFDIGLQGTIRN